MWYVIQVRTGREESTIIQCKKEIPSQILERCFLPYYKEKKNLNGKWETYQKILFPGYIFVVTDQLDELQESLKKVIGLTRLLAVDEEIVPLSEEEVCFLKHFGGEEQVVEMSTGIIVGSRTIVQSGPLKGMEGYIRRIDRHKRKAWLEVNMFGRAQLMQVGLEIVSKM